MRGQKSLDVWSSMEDNYPMGILREVVCADVLLSLRMAVGQPPRDPVPGEELARLGRAIPERVEIDLGVWIAWCLGGLVLLDAQRQPTRSAAVSEAMRFAVVVAMDRWGGNLTHAASALETSRRALRDFLRSVRLYPWPGRSVSPPQIRTVLTERRERASELDASDEDAASDDDGSVEDTEDPPR